MDGCIRVLELAVLTSTGLQPDALGGCIGNVCVCGGGGGGAEWAISS